MPFSILFIFMLALFFQQVLSLSTNVLLSLVFAVLKRFVLRYPTLKKTV